MKIKTKPIKKNLSYAFMPMLAYVGIEVLMTVVYVFLIAFPKLSSAIASGEVVNIAQMEMLFSEILASDSILLLIIVNAGVFIYALRSFIRSESHAYDRRYENKITVSDVGKLAVMAVGMYFSVNIVMTVLVGIFDSLGVSMTQLNDTVTGMVDMNMPLTIFSVVIVAPVVEELLVRGLIFNRYRAVGSPAFAICMSAFIFASMHFPVIVQCVYTFAVGAVFAWAYYKYENILVPIILHIIYNMCSFIFMIPVVSAFFSTFGGIIVFYLLGVGLTVAGVKFIGNKQRPDVKEEFREAVRKEDAEDDGGYIM